MEEKPQKKNVRDSLAEQFIKILESNEPLQWVKTWSSGRYSLPYNGQSERRYNGINRMILMFKAMEMGWSDPRYYTFHQVSQMDGCKIRAGEKATAVEYWLVRDTKQKKSMTFTEYEKLLKDDPSRKEVEFYAYPKVMNDLATLQKMTGGGFIECVYPFDDPVGIICDEEGKLNSAELNRSLKDEHGNIVDILAGPFLVVGLSDEDFASLSKEHQEKYSKMFEHPEIFFRVGNEIKTVKMDVQERAPKSKHR